MQENELLGNFEWDADEAADVDFFKTSDSELEIPEKKTKEKEEGSEGEPTKVKSESEEDESSEDDVKFFDNEDEESSKEETEDKEKPDEEESDKSSGYVSALNALKEKGYIDYELEEGQELTEEVASDLLEESIESKVEGRVEELVGQMPEESKALFSYVINGGNLNEFLETAGKSSISIDRNIDLEKEENQELVIRQKFKEEGLDDEDIDYQIDTLKDGGKLKKFSEKYFEKWKAEDDKNKEAEVEKVKAQNKQRKEQQRQIKKEFTDLLNSEESFNGLKLSKKEKSEIIPYLLDNSVELENGNKITALQRDIHNFIGEDRKNAIFLAKLAKSKFNLEDIKKDIRTEETKKIKNNLQRDKKEAPAGGTTKGKRNSQPKAAWDYF